MEPRVYVDHLEREESHWWFRARREVLEQVLRERLPPVSGRTLLDVGCGTGGNLQMLRQFGAVEGFESEAFAVDAARKKNPGLTVHHGALPEGMPAGTWDVVTMFDVLEHLQTPEQALPAIRSHLKRDGTLVVTVPAWPALWSEHDELNHHFRRYTPELLRAQLTGAGFRIDYESFYNSLLFPLVAAARLAERLRGAAPKGQSDLHKTPGFADRIFYELFRLERRVVPKRALPIGVSLLAIARPG